MAGRGRSPDRDSPVIKVRGLPYEATALDLCKFFTDCKIKAGPRGIYFTLNERKQPTGEAFIEMTSYRDVNSALRRHRDRMGSRYLEIFESRASVLEKEIKNGATNAFGFNENRRDHGSRSFDRSSSFDRGYDRSSSFDRGFDRGGGRYSGGGQFSGYGGGGYRDRSPVRGFGRGGGGGYDDDRGFGRDRGGGGGFGRDRGGMTSERGRDKGPPKSKVSDYVVKLRGLPWSVTKDEIADFLTDSVHIVGGQKGILILMEEGRDRPSGDAYVEVESDKDVSNAIKQHKNKIGVRYVEVFEANVKDVARAKDKEVHREALKAGYSVKLRGIPYSATVEEVKDWLSEAADAIEVVIPDDRRGRPSGQAIAHFKTAEEANTVVREMHKRDMGARYIECLLEGGGGDIEIKDMRAERKERREKSKSRSSSM